MSTEDDPPGGPPKDPSSTTPPSTSPAKPPTDTSASPSTTAKLSESTPSTTAKLPNESTPSATVKPPSEATPSATPTSETPWASPSEPRAKPPAAPVTPTSELPKPASTSAVTETGTDFLEAAPATEDSLLPTTYDANALQDAVGARRKKRREPLEADMLDEDALVDDNGKWSRKTIAVIALSLIVGLGITALVLLGRVNSQRYVLACRTSQAVAEQGRAFPPWGSAPLPGAEWKPVALPPNAQCTPRDLDDKSQLEGVFLDLLLQRSSATLTLHNFLDPPTTTANPLELVSEQLEQALLLSRSPARGDQRKQVERLQGDVQYWRASLRLRDAAAAMTEASRQFDQAALARPMHVSDAGAWAEFLRRLNEELKAGPNGVPAGFPPAPMGERPAGAPMGAALPVEPPPAESDEAPAPSPDAGVPTGGVLL